MSTLQPSASAFSTPASLRFTGLSAFLPFQPRLAAHGVPLSELAGFHARGGATRRLPESEPEGRSVLKVEAEGRNVLTSDQRERADKLKMCHLADVRAMEDS